MSRSGYIDDYENYGVWRGVIASATRGKRGQAFFRALVAALDTLPEKRLVTSALERGGEYCALGAVAAAKGEPLGDVDTYDHSALGELFDIAPQLAQEVMYVNDEEYLAPRYTPEERWIFVRKWAARQIRVTADELLPAEQPGRLIGGNVTEVVVSDESARSYVEDLEAEGL